MSDNTAPVESVPEDTGPVEQELPGTAPVPEPGVATVFMQNAMYPEGFPLEVPGLGAIPNMGSKEVTYVMAVNYENATNKTWPVTGTTPDDLTIVIPEEVTE